MNLVTDYICFPAHAVYELHDWTTKCLPDAYVASDALTDAILTALAQGYKWTRTEGDYAIFERTRAR
jgi:peptidoglycan/xylan/chitin deacetylase (PgdA/CDA1 family)